MEGKNSQKTKNLTILTEKKQTVSTPKQQHYVGQ